MGARKFATKSVYCSLWQYRAHGDPTDMRESTSVFQIRTINWSKLDKLQESVNRLS